VTKKQERQVGRFTFVSDSVSRGETSLTYEYISQPHDAVGIVAAKSSDICLVEQFRQPVRQRLLGIPGGRVEQGETAIQAAAREFSEETGHRLAEPRYILTFYPCPTITTQRIHLFVGEVGEPVDGLTADPAEADMVVRWVSGSDIVSRIADGSVASSVDAFCLLYFLQLTL